MGNKKSNKGHNKSPKKGNKNRTQTSGSKEGSFDDIAAEPQHRDKKKKK